ncbi:hypothetical protein [Micromonospora sp. SL4-19]|uniref:hypothetical protein n=1 Tax=Micromonospora sp. SL4-19 TaxID=3399129 RepID=UPI003A4D9D8A
MAADAKRPERGLSPAVLGSAALGFLLLIALQNVLHGVLGPAQQASAADLSALTHEHAWMVHLFAVTYVLGLPALLLFSTNLVAWCRRRNPAAAPWGRLGVAASIVVAALFAIVNVVQVTMVAARDELAAAPALASLLWTFHNAVFTFNMAAVGVTLFGLGRAASLARVVPAWMSPTTAAGAALLIAAAMPAVAVTNGSLWFAVGAAGFAVWMLFLAVVGVSLLRMPWVAAETEPVGATA